MGLDLGLEASGFHSLAFVEYDQAAQQTIQTNLQRLNRQAAVFSDVRQVTAQDLLQATGLRKGEVALVSGGPPCQPFSTAGKREAINDPRGSLFRDFVRIIDGLQPRFFVMENVRGLLSSAIKHRPIKHRATDALDPDEEPGSAFRVVLSELEGLGYRMVHGLLNAADYGVGQVRERVIILGSRDHEDIRLPAPTHSSSGLKLPRWITLRQALQGLHDLQPQFPVYPESRAKYLRLVPEGGNWRDLPAQLIPEAMGGAYHSSGGKVGFYRRLAWDKPSPTITTSPAQKATDMCHPSELRPLSVRETARLQGFPDDWVFCGTLADQYRQIGNAVPVQLGLAIGQSLRQTIDGSSLKRVVQQGALFESAQFAE